LGEVFSTENKFTNNNIYIKPNLKEIESDNIILSAERESILDINETETINGVTKRKYDNYSGFGKITIPRVAADQGEHTCNDHTDI
jgi:hypothetical protein